MSFRITGHGFYRTRDGRKAEVVAAKSTCGGFRYWTGQVEGFGLVEWWPNGEQETGKEKPNDLIAPLGEPVAAAETTQTVPAPTPYHRTEQFRAETARMLFVGTRNSDNATAAMVATSCVTWTDALIAALDKPQPKTE